MHTTFGGVIGDVRQEGMERLRVAGGRGSPTRRFTTWRARTGCRRSTPHRLAAASVSLDSIAGQLHNRATRARQRRGRAAARGSTSRAALAPPKVRGREPKGK